MDGTHTLTLVSRPGAGPMGAFYITIAELIAQLSPEELQIITQTAYDNGYQDGWDGYMKALYEANAF